MIYRIYCWLKLETLFMKRVAHTPSWNTAETERVTRSSITPTVFLVLP